MEASERRLNLEPDFKRMLIRPRMVEVAGTRHVAFESAPHRNLAEAKYHRELMDSWRVDHVLKTMADWDDFSEVVQIQRIAKTSRQLRIKKGERADGLFLRLFLRAYTQEQLGLERSMSIPQVVEYFSKHGYDLKASQLGSAKRAKLILGAVPKVASTLKLLEIILEAFPGFEYEPMFITRAEDGWDPEGYAANSGRGRNGDD
ncbi:hypothetical protein F6455_13025 [Proteobacteria bacterium 005FR1]|nr:hypothetical protein [Proteobacteria bacterium 005FR1]